MRTQKMILQMALGFLLTPSAYAQQDRAAFETARDACATELGLPARGSGTRPTREQMEAMKTCLEGKGFKHPSGGGPHHRRSEGPPPNVQPEANGNSGQTGVQ